MSKQEGKFVSKYGYDLSSGPLTQQQREIFQRVGQAMNQSGCQSSGGYNTSGIHVGAGGVSSSSNTSSSSSSSASSGASGKNYDCYTDFSLGHN